MKSVIAVWNAGGKGKSNTLRELARLLLTEYPNCRPIYPDPAVIPAKGDFRLLIEINKKIIAIETKGDPGTNLEERLIDLAEIHHCDLIFCTCRTSGETKLAVKHLSAKCGHEIIWTSTYQVADGDKHKLINTLKAKHLLDLVKKLGLL